MLFEVNRIQKIPDLVPNVFVAGTLAALRQNLRMAGVGVLTHPRQSFGWALCSQ